MQPGQYRRIQVSVTPRPGVAVGAALVVHLTAKSVDVPALADTAGARTTCLPSYCPDGRIRSGSTWLGDGIINGTGADQTAGQTANPNQKVTYQVRFRNCGNVTDRFIITGTAGNTRWKVVYSAGGQDVTQKVTTGDPEPLETDDLDPNEWYGVNVEVTPLDAADGNSQLTARLTATSDGDETKSDTVGTVTTCAPTYTVDGLIHSGAVYIGDEVFNTTGVDQTHSQSVPAGGTATYQVRFYNDGNADQKLLIRCRPLPTTWTVQFLDRKNNNADITTAVSVVGWETPELPRKGFAWIKILVSPGPSVPAGGSLSVLLTGTSGVDGTKKDAVKAVTTRN